MTEPLYLEAMSQRTFRATVDRAGEDYVVLDRTLFYPTGGGQPADTGTLRADDGAQRWAVTDVEQRETIRHVVDGPPPPAGTRIEGEIDWDRRYAHMRYHTAQHLLSSLLVEAFDAPTTGNQLYADRARIDCAADRFEPSALDRIDAEMNDRIDAGRPVRTYTLDRAEAEASLDPERTRLDLLPSSVTAVRIVEIEGYDRTACAGTHVASTAECGRFALTGRESKGAGEERLRFRLDPP